MSDCTFTFASNYNGHVGPGADGAPVHLSRQAVPTGTPHRRPVQIAESTTDLFGADFARLYADMAGLYGPYDDFGWFPIGGGRYERRYGDNFPFYRTQQELDWLRSASRWVAGWNGGHASGFLGGLGAYVIHKGILGKLTPRDGTNDPADRQLCNAAMDELEQFYERVQWSFWQQTVYAKSHIDGDVGLWMFDLGDRLELRTVGGEYIRMPPGERLDTWGYGVHTHPDDVQCDLGYWVSDADGSQGHYVEASNLILHRFFRPGGWEPGIRRGMPLFSFGIKEAFDSAVKILTNMGMGVAIRQAFAYIEEQAAGTGREDASDFTQTNADVSRPRPLNRARTDQITKAQPGYVPKVSPGYKYVNPPSHPETQFAIEVIDALLRNAGAVKNAPPWLMNTSGRDQAAYSSDLVHGAPFVRRCEQEQEYYGWPFLRILRRVLEIAIRCGRLRPETLQRCKLSVEYPSIVSHDKGEEASMNKTYVDAKIKSPQQVAQELGLDYEKQIREIAEHAKLLKAAGVSDQAGGAQGGAPAAAPPNAGQPAPAQPAPADTSADTSPPLDPFAGLESSAPAEISDSATIALMEGGFTGVITDSAGRKITFRDGKRVKASGGSSAGGTAKGTAAPTVGPNGIVKPAAAKPAANGKGKPAAKQAAPAGPLPAPASIVSNFAKLVGGAARLTDAKLNAIGDRIDALPAQVVQHVKDSVLKALAALAGVPGAVVQGVKAKAGAAKAAAFGSLQEFHDAVNGWLSKASGVIEKLNAAAGG